MVKYKSKITGKEVIIEDNYTNCNGVIPIIRELYENSNEWIKIFPVDESNINDIAKTFMEENCKGEGSTFTEDFKLGYMRGIEQYLRKNLK